MRTTDAPSDAWDSSIVYATPPSSAEELFWKVQVRLVPPTHLELSNVEMEYDVIGAEIHTHTSLIVLTHDYMKSDIADVPIVLGKLRAHRKIVRIER